MKIFRFTWYLGFVSLTTLSCSSNSAGVSGDGTPGITTNVSLGLGTSSSTELIRAITDGVFTSGAEGLLSLKYYIKSIRICQSLEVSGTAYNNPQGCLTLYSTDPNPDYEYTDPSLNYVAQADVARADTSENFIDLMSRDDRSRLSTTTSISESDVGEYRWGLVDWYLPIKVRAELERIGNSDKLYTKDGVTSAVDMGGSFRYRTMPGDDAFLTGPAEEAVVLLSNGGSWFRFQSPFTIEAADVGVTSFSLDLVFNPEGLIKAVKPASSAHALSDAVQSMNIPFLDLTPVPRRSSESTRVEIYRFTATGMPFDIRVGVYSIDGDSDRTVYGVELRTLLTADTDETVNVMDPPKAFFVEVNEDGSLDLQDYQSNEFIKNLIRRESEGDVTTATLRCSDQFNYAGCDDEEEVSLTGTLESYELMSE
jgi:hypothetical protein